VLVDLGRYGEAVEQFKRALANDLYRTPWFARGNLGWALYKMGDVANGVINLKQAVQLNTDFCQGYRSLGMIASDQGQLEEASTDFTAYVKHCPTQAEAHLRLGMVLLKMGKPGDQDKAKEQFGLCSSEGAGDLATECSRLLKLMQ
jgi:Tfp pilus assembly protein PilF